MTALELTALTPLIVQAVTCIVVMFIVGFYRNHLLTAVSTGTGLVLSFACLFVSASAIPLKTTALIVIDGYSLFFSGLTLVGSISAVILSYSYLETRIDQKEEYYLLVVLVSLGSCVVVSSCHFASFFLGLELLSVSFYALIAYRRETPAGLEAGVKYLILSAVSDAFLLFGMALIYADSGSLEFARMGGISRRYTPFLVWPGAALMVTGIGFKLSLVPLHMWTPDVYQGAPAPVTALLATISKVALFAVLVRYFCGLDFHASGPMVRIFSFLAVASMFGGSLLALLQTNVKRILAYSSIAHMGYVLVTLLATGKTALVASAYYLAAYAVTTLGAFGVISVLSGPEQDAQDLDEFRALAWKRPWLALVFTVMLLSLAGIPLTAGFIGKFYVVAAGIGSQLWLLITSLIVTSVISLVYYLRIVVTMYDTAEEPGLSLDLNSEQSLAAALILALLTVILILMGVYPSPLVDLIETSGPT